MYDEPEPIDDSELLFRRVSASANPRVIDTSTRKLSDQAFAPNSKRDVSGLSVYRQKFKSAVDVARGQPGKFYYVAVLRAGDLRKMGIEVVPRPNLPNGYDVAHAELPELNSGNYKDDATQERQRILVTLCLEVLGPFETPVL